MEFPRGTGEPVRARGADVGLETALLERTSQRTRHTARSNRERRTRPRCAPGPPGPGLEVARGGGLAALAGGSYKTFAKLPFHAVASCTVA
jgi:hypothetical protein